MQTHNALVESVEALEALLINKPVTDSSQLLIQVFSGIVDKNSIEKIAALFRFYYPLAHLIGSTTDGEISSGHVSTHHCSIAFSHFESTNIRVAIRHKSESDNELGYAIAKELTTPKTKVLILIAAGLSIDGNEVLKGVNRHNKHLTVTGGMAADNSIFQTPFIFTKDTIATDAAVGAVLDNPSLCVHTKFRFDWKLIGQTMEVTKAEGNRLYMIDGKSAVDTYAQYLGQNMADNLPAVGSEFPLVLMRHGMTIARAAMVKHVDGSLTLAGDVKPGDKVQFGFGNPSMILDTTKNLSKDISAHPVETIFVYSCMGRRRFMPQLIEKEILPLETIAPVSGFFTYGEFYHHEDENELLNQTMTILALSEKEGVSHSTIAFEEKEKESNFDTTLQALAYFVNSTLESMAELNDSLEEKVRNRTQELEAYKHSLELQVEAEIAKRHEKEVLLMQQSRLAAMGEMVGNIAHQWRQPLNTLSLVIGNLEDTYEMGMLTDESIHNAANKAYNLIDKMSATIDDFRNFFSADKQISTFNAKEIVSDSIALVEAAMKSYEIEIIDNTMVEHTICGYKNELSQVILNLINNAKDALLERKPKHAKIVIESRDDESSVCLVVSDNGGGVPDTVIERIFEPYFTTKEQGKGTGIGLYMSKTIVEEHMNGFLTVHNNEDGAVFTITLPKDINNKK